MYDAMNDTIKTLLNRRSIRKFKPEQIKDEELEAILEAGKYAPSGSNQQSCIFIVIQDKETLKKISEMNAAVMGKENFDPYYGAPTVILVLANKNKATPVEDGCLALGNMLNAAYSLGLGSCWVHREKQMFETKEGRDLLKIWGVESDFVGMGCGGFISRSGLCKVPAEAAEGDYIGVGACALGYPDCEHPQPAPRKDNYVIRI